jgi:hypothetical protein
MFLAILKTAKTYCSLQHTITHRYELAFFPVVPLDKKDTSHMRIFGNTEIGYGVFVAARISHIRYKATADLKFQDINSIKVRNIASTSIDKHLCACSFINVYVEAQHVI